MLICWCFLVCSHYASSYYEHYHSTCDCCVLQTIVHPYNGYACFHLCGSHNIRSARCGSAITAACEDILRVLLASQIYHNNNVFSLRCLLRHITNMHEVLTGKYHFQSWTSKQFHMSCVGVCFILLGSHVALVFTCGGSTIQICNAAVL